MPALLNVAQRIRLVHLVIFGAVAVLVMRGTRTAPPQVAGDSVTKEFLRQLDRQLRCASYVDYAQKPHAPVSSGEFAYPYMRPPPKCRTFVSSAVEAVISDLTQKLKDPDLARLFENCLPNTLDTTILWHSETETFVVTGDIHAEWLRDSARQLSVYQPFVQYDGALRNLIKGAIRTQERYIKNSPYCNAFHPPPNSGVKKGQTAMDNVYPQPDWKQVFECKYELDSLALFLTLTNEYLENSRFDYSVITRSWVLAFEKLLLVLKRESQPLFSSETGDALPFYYLFQRHTNIGSETLPLGGVGNPVNFNTGLVRSAFRPLDDATIFQFFIPGNAHMLTELRRTLRNVLTPEMVEAKRLQRHREFAEEFAAAMERGIERHGIVHHPKWGKVYAYEVDGYGGAVLMDDANIPLLLSLPDIGFTTTSDPVYRNTRLMVLAKLGNPYFLTGRHFEGIGGPHIGVESAWPMLLLVRIRTSDDDDEIMRSLRFVMQTTAGLGLMHESVNVNSPHGQEYTRPWFAWCNLELAKTVLHLARHKPHLVMKDGGAYDVRAVLS